MQSRLESLGLSTLGIWNRPDQMGVIDFTGVASNIKFSPYIHNNVSKFTVVVTDRQGKTSEPATFTINTIQATLNLSNPSELPIGGNTLSLDVEFNGADLQEERHIPIPKFPRHIRPLDHRKRHRQRRQHVPRYAERTRHFIRPHYPRQVQRHRKPDNHRQATLCLNSQSKPTIAMYFSTKAIIEVKCATADPEAIARKSLCACASQPTAEPRGSRSVIHCQRCIYNHQQAHAQHHIYRNSAF